MTTAQHQRPTTDGGAESPHPGITVENPATGAPIRRVPEMDAQEVAGLVERARAAQPDWAAAGFAERRGVALDLRRWLIANRARVIDTIVEETGKTREDALIAEIAYVADGLGFWGKKAEKYLRDERIRAHSPLLFGKQFVLRYRPHGVVGVIGPWNYPLTNNFGDAIPALMAGNTVVLKPSEVTPLTSLLMAEALEEIGAPRDIYLVATGGGEAGGALVDNVDMVMFTGSTRTGRKVAAQAAERLIPASLELGGKDPMIVLEDADLARAANAAVTYALSNGGQTCISVERVYVAEAVHDAFVSRVVEQVRGLRQGPPGALGSVDVGAVTFPDQLETIERHVTDAVEKGAQVLTGGRRGEAPGRFYEPTVLTEVDHSMQVMTEETFGPVLPIMRVGSKEEAVRLANDSPYGLDASVWGGDVEEAGRIARELESGAVCVNDAVVNYLALELPFGGAKESGLGARHGAAGIRKYCATQSLMVTRMGLKREANFLPYARWRSRAVEGLLVALYGRGRSRRR